MNFKLKVRDDASGYYSRARGKIMDPPFATFEDAEEIRRAMINGVEFEVIAS